MHYEFHISGGNGVIRSHLNEDVEKINVEDDIEDIQDEARVITVGVLLVAVGAVLKDQQSIM